MPRTSRLITATAALVVCAVLAPTAVSAQIDADEMTKLEARRDELTVTIAGLESAVADLDAQISELDGAIVRAELSVELLADDFERLVDARREPEHTRIEIAIAGYVTGDPRRNALLDEFDAIQGTVNEPARRRQFYDAVIEDTVKRLDQIDEQLRVLATEVDSARAAGSALDEQRTAAATQRQDLGNQLTALQLELDEVVARIAVLRSLENRAVLTGLPNFNDPNRPALVIKIDNVGPAVPQAGINQADIVWEEVVEGGFSRLAAVFHSEAPTVVGPIRSMRTSDVDLLEQLDSPLFANSGGNRVTTELIAESRLVNIGAAVFDEPYYRDTSRSRPANLFANTLNLWAVGASDEARAIGTAGRPFPLWSYRQPGDPPHPEAVPATGVDIDFGSMDVSYDWNGAGWARTQNGSGHLDTSGQQVVPTNLIVQFTAYGASEADPSSPHAFTIGSNPAWIFTNGTVVKGTWRRDVSTDPVVFVDSNGQPIALEPGRTWIALAPMDAATLR